MTVETLHLSVLVGVAADAVYDFASDPANLPRWAAGLGSAVTRTDDGWVADSPMGEVGIVFAERNDYGVLDHWVTLPSGETVYNPLRVLADGAGSEVVFTLRRGEGVDEEAFAADADAVRADLIALRDLLEAEPKSQG